MKKFPFIALLVFLAFGLPATAVFALDPACDPQFAQIQREHADAMRARNKAYATQIIKKPDTAQGLTCFDQSLRNTSRLGLIFSDRITVPLPANTQIYNAPLAFPNFGIDNLLATELDMLVSPVLSSFLGNFTGTLSEILGTSIGSALTSFVSALSGNLSAVTSGLSGVMSTVSTVTSAVSTLNNLVRVVLPSTPPIGVPVVTGLISAARSALNSAMSGFQSLMSGAISGPLAAIAGMLLGPGADMNCNRMPTLWNDYNPSAGAASIIGNGIELGTPYVNLGDFLSSVSTGMGTDYLDSLTGATSSNAITQAAAGLLRLNAPGGIPSWKTPPVFAPNASTASIISGM